MDLLARLDRFASFERSGGASDLSPLAAIQCLLEDLDHPERRFEVVHVAGTQGKGLTAAMIDAILRKGGLRKGSRRTGLYTSPHVLDVREEIQIDGAWIDPMKLDQLAGRVLAVASRLAESSRPTPSRFDLMTALAFLAFAEFEVEVAVVEVGLGGRFDSTNVFDSSLAVITSLDLDHTAILGESLDEIAAHKLGILRPGARVVLAPQSPDASKVLRQQLEQHHPESRVVSSQQLSIASATGSNHLELTWPDGEVHRVPCDPHFPRRAHLDGVRTALTVAEVLRPTGEVPSRADRVQAVRSALSVTLPGRLNYLEDFRLEGFPPFPVVVLDGGHSPAALRACAAQLDDWGLEDYTLILGLSRDKLTANLEEPLAALCRPAQTLVLTAFASPRCATPTELAAWLADVQPVLADTVSDALRRAAEAPDRPLVIAGSLYLIREVLAANISA